MALNRFPRRPLRRGPAPAHRFRPQDGKGAPGYVENDDAAVDAFSPRPVGGPDESSVQITDAVTLPSDEHGAVTAAPASETQHPPAAVDVAVMSPPPSALPAVSAVPAAGDAESVIGHLRKLEGVLQEYKVAVRERDEARARTARLEREAAEANERLAQLRALEERAADLQRKLEAAVRSGHTIAQDNAKLKARLAESEKQAHARAAEAKTRIEELESQLKRKSAEQEAHRKQFDERLKAAEVTVKKWEVALANSKEGRDELQQRIDAAIAALQGKTRPASEKT